MALLPFLCLLGTVLYISLRSIHITEVCPGIVFSGQTYGATSEKTGRGRGNSHDFRLEKAGLEMRAWDGRKHNVSILWPDTSKFRSFVTCSLSGAAHLVVTQLAAPRQGLTCPGNKL